MQWGSSATKFALVLATAHARAPERELNILGPNSNSISGQDVELLEREEEASRTAGGKALPIFIYPFGSGTTGPGRKRFCNFPVIWNHKTTKRLVKLKGTRQNIDTHITATCNSAVR